jgi:hypothetical protein
MSAVLSIATPCNALCQVSQGTDVDVDWLDAGMSALRHGLLGLLHQHRRCTHPPETCEQRAVSATYGLTVYMCACFGAPVLILHSICPRMGADEWAVPGESCSRVQIATDASAALIA